MSRQGGTISVNLTALTAEGQSLARAALATWTDIIGVNFIEVLTGGQIAFDDNEEGAFSDGVWSARHHYVIACQCLDAVACDYGTG